MHSASSNSVFSYIAILEERWGYRYKWEELKIFCFKLWSNMFWLCYCQPGISANFYGSRGQVTLSASSACSLNSSHSRAHTTECVWEYLEAKYEQHIVHLIRKHCTGIHLASDPWETTLPSVLRFCYSFPLYKGRKNRLKFLKQAEKWKY